MNLISRSLALLAALLFAQSTLAAGADFDDSPGPKVSAAFISSVTQAAPGSSFEVLLEQTIAYGWHTYWINPGDSGATPELTFDVPEGVVVGEFAWPYPERIAYGPLMNYGYHDRVLSPFTVTIPQDFDGDSLALKATGRILVCADICIPEQVEVALSIPVGATQIEGANPADFTQARAMLPQPAAVPASYTVEGEAITANIGIPYIASNRLAAVEYFPYKFESIDNPAEQAFSFDESGLKISLRTGFDYSPGADLSGVLVVREDELTSAYEITLREEGAAPVTTSPTTTAAADEDMSLALAALFAFLGGLILNLMPCVFPVLSIKILSLVEGVGEGSVRLHGWVYSAGVVFSFVAIAAVLIGLQASGEAIGWGFQLQSPWVVALLAYLFVLIGLNLAGVFEIGTSFMALGSAGDGQSSSSLGSSFGTGVLATTVAAPCTAPFMGAAIGFALTQPAIAALAVFAVLGAGMAAPYLLLTYSPALLNKMPRPGAWMETLKQFLAFPMFASAIWLVWVLGIQVGPTGMMQVLAGALLLSLAVWLLARRIRSTAGSVARYAAVLGLAGVAGYAVAVQEAPTVRTSDIDAASSEVAGPIDMAYTPYSASALAAARTNGPVFVNFTAAWCITCKVNELNALSSEAFRDALAAKNVTYLKGDWTSEDPVITAALEDYGRSGVPLYLLYREGEDRAEVLPQILTEAIVLDAIGSL